MGALLAGILAGHDPTRALGQEVLKKKNARRVGSSRRVFEFPTLGLVGLIFFQISRIGSGHPDPARPEKSSDF